MIHKDRIRHFIAVPPAGSGFVLYWMQQAQRTRFNHAFAFAARKAEELKLPVVVGFVLMPDFPEAGFRHYKFMLEGIADVQRELFRLDIEFVLKTGDMVGRVIEMAENAAWVVTDAGYLKIQRGWRNEVADRLYCPFTVVETDAAVPVTAASDKEEISARTLRPRILKKLDYFLDPKETLFSRDRIIRRHDGFFYPIDPVEPGKLASEIKPGEQRGRAEISFRGGQTNALRRLKDFVEQRLANYGKLARDPAEGCSSGLSPYLHFGQISPVEIILKVRNSDVAEEAKQAFIEQVLIRRELALNFVYYNSEYDRYEGAVPGWARRSLDDHRKDARPYLYSLSQLEQGKTHDPYWNAAQAEMVNTGTMHNYMRMYWGKKIMEWSSSPEEAYRIMLGLNNRWQLDGRDPNGFAGVAWCFGRHDRPWKERPVFGKIRYMNAAGLERKFKISDYVKKHL